MVEKQNILFVCTGNTCRSSMAEALAKYYLSNKGKDEVNIAVHSAGTGAVDDDLASYESRKVMSELKIDLEKHRAKLLTPALIEEADLILTMTKRHKEHIVCVAPQARGKVYLLKEYAEGPERIKCLQAEAQTLYEEIQSKKRKFFQDNQEEILALEEKKKKLLQELKEVEAELELWERKLEKIAEAETKRLQKLEAKAYNFDVSDPFGYPLEYYRICRNELQNYVFKVLERLLEEKS